MATPTQRDVRNGWNLPFRDCFPCAEGGDEIEDKLDLIDDQMKGQFSILQNWVQESNTNHGYVIARALGER